jgi:hypothetical protein
MAEKCDYDMNLIEFYRNGNHIIYFVIQTFFLLLLPKRDLFS